jgi:hypothetical protein
VRFPGSGFCRVTANDYGFFGLFQRSGQKGKLHEITAQVRTALVSPSREEVTPVGVKSKKAQI